MIQVPQQLGCWCKEGLHQIQVLARTHLLVFVASLTPLFLYSCGQLEGRQTPTMESQQCTAVSVPDSDLITFVLINHLCHNVIN